MAPFGFFLLATLLGVEGDPLSFPMLVAGAVLILVVFLYAVVVEYFHKKDPALGKRTAQP